MIFTTRKKNIKIKKVNGEVCGWKKVGKGDFRIN